MKVATGNRVKRFLHVGMSTLWAMRTVSPRTMQRTRSISSIVHICGDWSASRSTPADLAVWNPEAEARSRATVQSGLFDAGWWSQLDRRRRSRLSLPSLRRRWVAAGPDHGARRHAGLRDVLSGRREPGEKIPSVVGLCRVVTYEPVPGDA